MPTDINRGAYERLIEEDIVWLKAQPRTLERDHIVAVLSWSIEKIYGPPEAKEASE